MLLRYESGVEIKQGDRVIWHGEPAEIEFIVTARTGDPAMDWYVDQFGGGVMIHTKGFGNVFLHADSVDQDEDLEFISRV